MYIYIFKFHVTVISSYKHAITVLNVFYTFLFSVRSRYELRIFNIQLFEVNFVFASCMHRHVIVKING